MNDVKKEALKDIANWTDGMVDAVGSAAHFLLDRYRSEGLEASDKYAELSHIAFACDNEANYRAQAKARAAAAPQPTRCNSDTCYQCNRA